MENTDKIIKDLTLMLLYLSSWVQKGYGNKHHRAWKGYDFDVLNKLSDEDIIVDGKRSKSVALTDEGVQQAVELLKKYEIV